LSDLLGDLNEKSNNRRFNQFNVNVSYCRGNAEELIEPTKTVLETIEVVSPASDTVTNNPFDQLMQFVFMALFMVI